MFGFLRDKQIFILNKLQKSNKKSTTWLLFKLKKMGVVRNRCTRNWRLNSNLIDLLLGCYCNILVFNNHFVNESKTDNVTAGLCSIEGLVLI